MRFNFVANATFEAANLDDAFLKLSQHFKNLAGDIDNDEENFFIGEMHLSPVEGIKTEVPEGGKIVFDERKLVEIKTELQTAAGYIEDPEAFDKAWGKFVRLIKETIV